MGLCRSIPGSTTADRFTASYVVGWAVHTRESQELAAHLISKTVHREGVNAGELTLHADRGSPMTARHTIELLDELGIKRSHSRPRVSNYKAWASYCTSG